ncbi:hypothetical protein FO519_002570 [Halicephalobus sp. NKZ332]|nr:hypothetical protein FO519_002570 [Halicephalobus sp. NKZ332]
MKIFLFSVILVGFVQAESTATDFHGHQGFCSRPNVSQDADCELDLTIALDFSVAMKNKTNIHQLVNYTLESVIPRFDISKTKVNVAFQAMGTWELFSSGYFKKFEDVCGFIHLAQMNLDIFGNRIAQLTDVFSTYLAYNAIPVFNRPKVKHVLVIVTAINDAFNIDIAIPLSRIVKKKAKVVVLGINQTNKDRLPRIADVVDFVDFGKYGQEQSDFIIDESCGEKPSQSTTQAPTEGPTTEGSVTGNPTEQPSEEPTTEGSGTEQPSEEPTTERPVTENPTEQPSTEEPTTVGPTASSTGTPTEQPSEGPTTEGSVTEQPSEEPTTEGPVTENPTEQPSEEPTTEGPVTENPTEQPSTEEPTTVEPTASSTGTPTEQPSEGPTTEGSVTEQPSEEPTTEGPVTENPTEQPSEEPTTEGPVTENPTEQPSTEEPTTVEPTASSTAWLDVVFVIDTSSVVRSVDLNRLGGTIAGFFTKFTIDQENDQSTRVGIITYSEEPKERDDLEKFKNWESLYSAFTEIGKYRNDRESAVDIGKALKEGQQLLKKQNSHRIPVIVVIGASSNSEYVDPEAIKTALEIKKSGIKIVSLTFKTDSNTSVTPLNELASKQSYGLVSTDPDLYGKLSNILAEVNCICPLLTFQFNFEDQIFGDCVQGFHGQTPPSIAQLMCELSDGILVPVTTKAKLDFLTEKIVPIEIGETDSFTIGLHHFPEEDTEEWIWQYYNKTQIPLGSFQDWQSGSPEVVGESCGAATKGSNSWAFVPSSCDHVSAKPYICQTKACDSTHFCDLEAGIRAAQKHQKLLNILKVGRNTNIDVNRL